MVRFLTLSILLAMIFPPTLLKAQDTLPDFTAVTRGNNRILIGWTNSYPIIKQISIQRSFDSTKNFKTILTVPDPTPPQNGYVDTKAENARMFYRLFIVLDSGRYVFSKSRRPRWDSSGTAASREGERISVNGSKQVVVSEDLSKQEQEQLKGKIGNNRVEPEKNFVVLSQKNPPILLPENRFARFRDSVVNRTRDTLVFQSIDTILIKSFIPREIYKPSDFIFTEKDGNVIIRLPEALSKTYSIKFFEDDQTPLFEIEKVREPRLILDKSNFLHAGWFRFELYDNKKLKEKHRFFIPKDF